MCSRGFLRDRKSRPDPKSRTAQEIAWQILCEERMLIDALESGKGEWSPAPAPATMKEIVAAYEKQSASITEAIGGLAGRALERHARLVRKGAPDVADGVEFLVRHRSSPRPITTYLRPMGLTVPQIYGPSADEP